MLNFKKGELAPKNNSIFKEDNPNGYFSKSEFKDKIDLLDSDVQMHYKLRNLDNGFTAMKASLALTKMPNHVFNDGVKGTWLAFQIGKVKRNLFIHHFGDMERLIDDYASGKLKIERTLEEYYKEAREA